MRGLAIVTLLSFAVPALGQGPTPLRLIDRSTPVAGVWDSSDYAIAQAAVQNQLNSVTLFWHKRGVTLCAFNDGCYASWTLTLTNRCVYGGVSYAGYHLDSGSPSACVATVGVGDWWTITRDIEHEASEMTADPSTTGKEIVDPVAGIFATICNGAVVMGDETTCAPGWPLQDFILRRKERAPYGFIDFLKQEPFE
jgi:hypothetical protein